MRGCLAFRLLIFVCFVCYSCFWSRAGKYRLALRFARVWYGTLHCACSGMIRHFALRLLGADKALCTALARVWYGILHCACSGLIRHFALRFAPGMSRRFILCFLPSFASALLAVMRHILHRVVYLAPLSVCVFSACEGAMQYGLSAFLVFFTPSCKKSPNFRRFPSIYLIKRNGNLKCKFTFFKFHFSVREIS